MIQFFVPGQPKGKGRPRFDPRSKRAYTPQKSAEYERYISMCCRRKGGPARMSGPLGVEIDARFAIPKQTTKKMRAQMDAGAVQPCKRPDIDNVVKSVLDALNGVAYEDDKQVVRMIARKRYSECPGVMVTVYEIGEMDDENSRN
ncbi:RusA family crossover junction endodeoxyribonuclease [Selenomonas montiformis]|uniref:RusA family crossover junction endodeoxyribonuclease n=1 Tax=Selenomonas montiformis TaxID=2652285 RepID=UPI003F89CDF5